MYRQAINDLIKWKNSSYRKPLIIEGARQVGKTWLMKEFGKNEYHNYIYINFDSNQEMESLFSVNLDTGRILRGIELYSGQKVIADETLLIFDEIQEVPNALTSLKYFNENNPEIHIICAGSLLGIALHHNTSFPVGKVDFLKLYPMTYYEFLKATGRENLSNIIQEKETTLINAFSAQFIEALKEYYFVGGMPEAVQAFATEKNFDIVRQIQSRILNAYEQDFSKHAPNDIVPKLRMVWDSIPSQLSKENRKFVYGVVREGARAKDYETAIMWLCDCGLANKVSRVSSGNLPLKAYVDLKAFKLYFVDVGLLCCLSGLSVEAVISQNNMFKEFKGALTEQYVLQQLTANTDLPIYYYTNDRASAEVDFVVDTGKAIVPIEVKAELNLQAKSLKLFVEKYNITKSIRTSMADYKEESWVVNVPLYMIGEYFK